MHATYPAHPPWFDYPNNIRRRAQIMEIFVMQFPPVFCHFRPLRSKYLHQISSFFVLPSELGIKFHAHTKQQLKLQLRIFNLYVLKGGTRTAQWYSAGLRAGWSGVRVPARVGNFFLHHRRPDQLWGPLSLLSNGYQGLFPGVKRPRREVDHSTPSSAEVKNAWRYTSTPQYAFMAWCSVKSQWQLHLYVYILKENGNENPSESNNRKISLIFIN
jgi:hypothetical protein